MRVRPKLVNLGLPDLNSGQNFRRVHDLTPFITSHKVQQTNKWHANVQVENSNMGY